jgi:hypothetical protein
VALGDGAIVGVRDEQRGLTGKLMAGENVESFLPG